MTTALLKLARIFSCSICHLPKCVFRCRLVTLIGSIMMTNLIVPPSTDFAIYGGASDCTSTQSVCVIHGACNILSLERSPSCITGTWVDHGRIRSGNARLFATSAAFEITFIAAAFVDVAESYLSDVYIYLLS